MGDLCWGRTRRLIEDENERYIQQCCRTTEQDERTPMRELEVEVV